MRTSLAASPAGLLLLALALICAAGMMKTAYGGDPAAEPTTEPEVNARRALATSTSTSTSTSASASASTTTGAASVQVATAVAVGKARLSFSTQRCVRMPKKVLKNGVTVWWKGSGNSNSTLALAGGQCAQVKFFEDGEEGREVHCMTYGEEGRDGEERDGEGKEGGKRRRRERRG
ncbi:unnamed protein product [Closterium sp. Naga37s-1]|nr:unnamed protein product [Closterium sp. Naga37s-1]